MTYATHTPVTTASWPILLLAGVDHSVVVAEAVKAAESDLIDSTLWVPIGRDEPPPADAAINVVEHGGTYRDVLGAVTWSTETAASGEHGTVMLVIDCISVLWSMLHAEARLTIDERAAAYGFPTSPAGVEITRDLWDARAQRWHRFVNVVRSHPGPVLLTAYVDEVALTNEAGDRTTQTRWELQAEKNLARSVSAMVQWRGGDPILSGLSLDDIPTEGVVDAIWRSLGLESLDVGTRHHVPFVPLSHAAEITEALRQVIAAADAAGQPREEIAAGWANSHGGQHISNATDVDELERVRDALLADAAAREAVEA